MRTLGMLVGVFASLLVILFVIDLCNSYLLKYKMENNDNN